MAEIGKPLSRKEALKIAEKACREERERCAKIAEEKSKGPWFTMGNGERISDWSGLPSDRANIACLNVAAAIRQKAVKLRRRISRSACPKCAGVVEDVSRKGSRIVYYHCKQCLITWTPSIEFRT